MAFFKAINIIATALLALHLATFEAFAQNCYYPDGSLSTEGDAACSSQGGACCPLNWQCMSNGLCYLENAGYYGRYTCTDQTWQSLSCPQICTHDNTANGNEAMLQCSDGDWCCDGNRVAFNCCTKADTNYFSLPSPSPIAFISSVPSPTSAKTVQNSPAPASDGTPAGSTSSSQSSHSSTTSSSKTITQESTTTGTDGSASTITQVVTVAPAAAGSSSGGSHTSHDHKSNIAFIVGLAVGIPVALIILAIAIFFAVRHMRRSNQYHSMHRKEQSSVVPANYANIPPGTYAPEIDSYPVAPGRTKSGRKSELYGSEPVILNSPNPSVKTNGSAPPQYSPGGRTEPMSQIQEEPQELWGSFVPYRVPRTELPEHGTSLKGP